jgi:hypothetical protein
VRHEADERLADAVRRFRPDHILIALRASDHNAWQEAGVPGESA